MLEFFRKYQKYFFFVITVVVIISFSFFGTYSTLINNSVPEPIAFTAVDGSQIKRSSLDEMLNFISTDSEDKYLFGGLWGPNFLNDGVIRKDFLQTGLATVLAAEYMPELSKDLQSKLEKEKRYTPYVHPQAKFLSMETAWMYLAPDVKENLDQLKSFDQASSVPAFDARTKLFLAERRFPAPAVRQVLKYQEKQYGWLTPDPELDRIDLSLFGYHTMDDWFGPRFMRIAAEFIINSAKIAEQKGYKVSKEEALADLMANSQASYKQNISNPYLGVRNSTEYFTEQLRRMHMDQNMAAQVWRQVMLFRRLFHDAGNAIVLEPSLFQHFENYAKEKVEGTAYRLPKGLQLNDYQALQKFEIYLNAISQRTENDKNILELPKKFLATDEIAEKAPELVEKRYLVELQKANKTDLQSKVSIRETWNWEVDPDNWAKLKKQFPELGLKKDETREAKFAALDSLDDRTRQRVDAMARAAIVDKHPEWLEKALGDAEPARLVLSISPKGGKIPLEGVEDRKTLLALLDQAALGQEDASLAAFSGDKIHFYKIKVIDRSSSPEILTFVEANKSGVLDTMLVKELEAYYKKIKEQNPEEFQNQDKTWKTFADAKNKVADLYFAKVLKAIQKDYASAIAPEKAPEDLIGDVSASLRLYSYARKVREALENNPETANSLIAKPQAEHNQDKLSPKMPLADQWKFEEEHYVMERSGEGSGAGENLFSLQTGDWSKVSKPVNGDLHFIHVKSKGNGADESAIAQKTFQAHKALSEDAQRDLMGMIVKELKDKNAISLEFMNKTAED